jgi:hypothetical protein
MTSIESVAQKGFFIGILALLVEFKIHLFEKSDIVVSGGRLEQAYKHVELIKELSPLLYIEYILMRGLYNFTQKEPSVEIFKELVEVFRFYKTYNKFVKALGIVQIIQNIENCLKYLILLYSISFRIKIDNNLLEFLHITDKNLLNITINDSITIDSIIKSKNFDYLTELNIRTLFKKKIESLLNTQIPNNEEVLNILYPKELGFRELTKADDILDLNAQFNAVFRNAYDLLK